MSVIVRPAAPDDAPAIARIHTSDVLTWRRWDEEGHELFARYEDLTPFERWLNGGPWMDESMLRPHLRRLIQGAGYALVAEADGEALAEAEAFVGDEPPPWGRNLNLSVLYTRRGSAGRGLGSALMTALFELARRERCDSFVVTHAEAESFYARFGLACWGTWRAGVLPVRESGTVYSAEAMTGWSYESVRGWGMPVGRYQSARQEWGRLAPEAVPDFPGWRHLRSERWRLTVRRAPAVLYLDELPHAPRGTANAHLWTPDGAMSRQLLTAVRDRAARSGFDRLRLFVPENAFAALKLESEADDYRQRVFGVRLG